MHFEWDPAKEKRNQFKHGVGFDLAVRFDFASALILVDDDIDYGEERLRATGFIGLKIYVLVYVERDDTIRVISLRRASRREVEDYVKS